MPDLIRSSSSTPLPNPTADSYADDAGKVSSVGAPNGSSAQASSSLQCEPPTPSTPAVEKLVSAVPQPRTVLPPPAGGPPASTANNNAQRTAERNLALYADTNQTASGDSVFAGAALLKGSVPKSTVQVEVLSVSGQIGAQTELQLGFQRLAGSHGALSGSVETFTAKANVGIHNDDGTTGFNLGAGVTAIGFEGSVGGASRLTYGVSAGMGAGLSVGVGDVDRDGNGELCARVSIGPVTVGACLENPL